MEPTNTTETLGELPSLDYNDVGMEEGNEDSDDDMDWEDVIIPHATVPTATEGAEVSLENTAETARAPIQITLERQPQKKLDEEAKERARAQALDRLIRLESHKLHVISLLASTSIRNRWVNDELLHARLLSLTPLPIQHSFAMITKKAQPDVNRRGRLFEAAVVRLVDWWVDTFEVDLSRGIRSRPFNEVREQLVQCGVLEDNAAPVEGKGKGKSQDIPLVGDDGEGDKLRSVKSLMKHALLMSGSRDTSALLFTALCRALGIPTRLVASLQAVGWKKGDDKGGRAPRKKAQDNDSAGQRLGGGDTEELEDGGTGSKGKGKAKEVPRSGSPKPTSRGRGGKTNVEEKKHAALSPSINMRPNSRPKASKSRPAPNLPSPPILWAEVFSRPDGRWIPVDPIRGSVNKRRRFTPAPGDVNNRMVYVVGFEEDGYLRDVTPRYAKQSGIGTAKNRAGKNGKKDWWESVLRILTRPYRLHRDDIEDAEFQSSQLSEGMPSSIGGFKSHPLYALERHLRRDEVIHPRTEIGKFRGESVYSRSSVQPLKTSDGWMRLGRNVKEGCQPLKMVKPRVTTVNRKRVIEAAEMEGHSMEQGMYAEWQTELYQPMPIVDGKIPKNDFGNIDLYVASMLPKGSVHVPYKGVAKVARQLGIDFAEAVTGFEFKKGHAHPVLTGIVVAAESEGLLLQAYWESAQAANEKERLKKQERVHRHWTRLIHGLRIRERLKSQYGGGAHAQPTMGHTEATSPAEGGPTHGGGFLTEVNEVVQPFKLPKFQHVADPAASARDSSHDDDQTTTLVENTSTSHNGHGDNGDTEERTFSPPLQPPGSNLIPKSMLELAEADASAQVAADSSDEIESQPPLVLERQSPTPTNEQSNRPKPRAAPRTRRASTRAAKAKPKPKASASTSTSRKRPRNAEPSPTSPPLPAGEDESFGSPPPAKRGKITVPVSTRSLRPRAAKSAEKLKQEEELERAYRRAIAD
ncbi:hypothetical protein BOTBODRAFT_124782 [Botryobasidium botryosum FD-172 SS1]|uniref:Rad4 beta-hairpin domain-containing protein n=1 Tax=Botryobasidium botryosum (strain FD-172 SS1) TaxID=930990 RepID=A0A067N9X5_BOTB1|nr:hypothetical protein BOTBODRAFT_124782 [Botryobasidium botryosum FD-172 SS1]